MAVATTPTPAPTTAGLFVKGNHTLTGHFTNGENRVDIELNITVIDDNGTIDTPDNGTYKVTGKIDGDKVQMTQLFTADQTTSKYTADIRGTDVVGEYESTNKATFAERGVFELSK